MFSFDIFTSTTQEIPSELVKNVCVPGEIGLANGFLFSYSLVVMSVARSTSFRASFSSELKGTGFSRTRDRTPTMLDK